MSNESGTEWNMPAIAHLFKIENLRWMLYGALLFWTPDILVHGVTGQKFDDIWLVTLLPPLLCILGYCWLAYRSTTELTGLQPGLMLLGIWCAGGIGTMLASSFAGGGFAGANQWHDATGISLATIVFPPLSFMLATYDGTLFALLGITLLLSLEAAGLSARRFKLRLHRASA
jgi:hypothetical protein